jgi:hypothetical protein
MFAALEACKPRVFALPPGVVKWNHLTVKKGRVEGKGVRSATYDVLTI